MRRILILSDTHGYLDDDILRYAAEVDEIWHGGDWGNPAVSDQLTAIKPVKGVYGNIDGQVIRSIYPLHNRFTCEGVKVQITHIAGPLGKYNSEVAAMLRADAPQIFVCGHSHILQVRRAPTFGNLLHINPGAAGIHGFHHVRTMVKLSIDGTRIFDAAAIELGKRGKIPEQPK